jgi:hypothetical protein
MISQAAAGKQELSGTPHLESHTGLAYEDIIYVAHAPSLKLMKFLGLISKVTFCMGVSLAVFSSNRIETVDKVPNLCPSKCFIWINTRLD